MSSDATTDNLIPDGSFERPRSFFTLSQEVALPTPSNESFTLSFNYSLFGFAWFKTAVEVVWNGEVIDTLTPGNSDTTLTYELDSSTDTSVLEFRSVGWTPLRFLSLEDVSLTQLPTESLFTDANDTVSLADDDPDYGTVEEYDALDGDDVVVGGDLDDIINGNTGNDILHGGTGDDVLIGSDEGEVVVERERTIEHDLSDLTDVPVEGINNNHFTLQNDHAVTLSLSDDNTGKKNSVGVYKIGPDGEIYDVEIVIEDASERHGFGWGRNRSNDDDISVELDLAAGDTFGLFIISDGDRKNSFHRLQNGHFEFRNEDGSQATIDSDAPELVFVDSRGRTKDIRGEVFHSNVSAGSEALNKDDAIHVTSASSEDGGLLIGFEDQKISQEGGEGGEGGEGRGYGWGHHHGHGGKGGNTNPDFDDIVLELSFAPVVETYQVVAEDNDQLFGEEGNDHLIGGFGDDLLDGGTGRDILDGGVGNDTLLGGGGKDELDGGDGKDNLFGNGGDDLIYGRAGKDKLVGGNGNDELYGGGGKDLLKGGNGEDELRGGNGDDELRGGAGDDLLIGGRGSDQIDGGEGDDTVRLTFGDGGADEFANGGLGTDKLKITVETDDLQDPAVVDALTQLSTFILSNADAGTDAGPTQAFAALGLEVQNFEEIDIKVIDSETGEVVEGFLTPEVSISADPVSGDEDTAIDLSVSAVVTNAPTLFDLSVTLSGIPAGSQVSAGTLENDGTVTLDASELAGLTLTPPADSSDDFDLTITAVATSRITGEETGFAPVQQTIEVNAVADAASLSVSDIALVDANAGDDVLDGTDGKDTLQGFGGNDTLTGGSGGDTLIGDGRPAFLTAAVAISASLSDVDGSESLSILVSGLPAKASLSAGQDNGDGSVTLTTNELPGLTISVPSDQADFSLDVTARVTDTDADSGLLTTADTAASSSVTLQVSIDGDDILIGGPGKDVIQGNGGNDQIDGDGGADTITAGTGNDVVNGGGGNDTIFGEGGDDQINGNGGDDIIDGGAGNDIVNGGGGSDQITGGAGLDTLGGGAGDDVIDGGDGDDIITGGQDNDILTGGLGNDDLNGNGGDNQLSGGAGDDLLQTSDGSDQLAGGDGNDTLIAGAGDDTLDGDQGDDNLQGEGGNDVIRAGLGADTVSGGNQDDWIDGGEGDDTLSGDGGADTLFGGAGLDIISGGAGKDVVDGGDGDDEISGDDGADTLSGGRGNDVLTGGLGADIIDGGEGIDLIHGDDGNDHLSGGDGADTLYGGLGRDTIEGGADADYMYGGDDNDTMHGGDYDDRMWGDAGADEMFGDAGNDKLYGGDNNDTLHGGTGNDTVRGEAGNDVLFGNDGNDSLIGREGSDTMYGGEGSDYLSGGDGSDVLYGDAGNDRIVGGGGKDTLFGGEGNDDLQGDNGADILNGGAGVDKLFGNNGSDRFVFDLSAAIAESGIGAGNRDTILDFNADNASNNADTIEFTGVVSFDFVGDETQAFSGTGASGRFNGNTKVLEIDADGDQQTDMELELSNVDAVDLDSTDFTVT